MQQLHKSLSMTEAQSEKAICPWYFIQIRTEGPSPNTMAISLNAFDKRLSESNAWITGKFAQIEEKEAKLKTYSNLWKG